MQIDFQVEIETSPHVSVEVDDSEIWDAVSEAVEEAAREAVTNCAWDEVSSSVEETCEEVVSNHAVSGEAIDERIESNLSEYNRRVENGSSLCTFGQQFRRAITVTIENMGGVTPATERLDKIEATLRDMGAALRPYSEPF